MFLVIQVYLTGRHFPNVDICQSRSPGSKLFKVSTILDFTDQVHIHNGLELILESHYYYNGFSFLYDIYFIAKCLASYIEDRQNFLFFFPQFYRLAQARNFGGKNHERNHGTRKFDAKYSANECAIMFFLRIIFKLRKHKCSYKIDVNQLFTRNNRQCNSQVVKLIMHCILTMPVWRINGNWNKSKQVSTTQ